ncbi:MAG: hypothetical protein JEZ00_03355 [Anaerolineaceae bacterium]|nr:hypothetical protein [Anaerolineaceae bacterium]
MRILLFDIDGVLLRPLGYRKAYFDTCNWIIRESGLKVNSPAEDIPALFESFGVTSEWDMLAITVSIILKAFLKIFQVQISANTLTEAINEISRHKIKAFAVDYRSEIQLLGTFYDSDEIPSVGVYQHWRSISGEGDLQDELLENILCHTRNVKVSLITKLFQNLVLGSDTFNENYGLQSIIECQSYLREFDQSLILQTMQNTLEKLINNKELFCAAFTARPSLGPKENPSKEFGIYSPEAELALDVVGMKDLLLIGTGHLQFIGDHIKTSADSLLKPNAFHALAAFFTILTNNESEGLQLAFEFVSNNYQMPKTDTEGNSIEYPDTLEIAVFEDSQGGIRSLAAASELLNIAGLVVNTRFFGISTNPDKMKPLTSLQAEIYPDINTALENHIYN